MNVILKLIKKQYLRILLNLLITIIFLSFVGSYDDSSTGEKNYLSIIVQLENIAYDYRVTLTMPNTVDERIVIIDIDEKSLAEVGRWPWGRDTMAKLTNQLFDVYGINLVGFDIVFAEEDKSSGLHILNKLAVNELNDQKEFVQRVAELEGVLDYDQLFLNSLLNRKVVLGYYFNRSLDEEGKLTSGKLPPPVYSSEKFSDTNIEARSATGYGSNLAKFQSDTTAAGHFNPSIDTDGVVRRIPMLYEYSGDYYESLSLSMVRVLLDVDEIIPVFEGSNETSSDYFELESLQLGDLKIPVDGHIQALVPYRGRKGSFKYISAIDVINGEIEKSEIQGRIALIGTSAPALYDLRATPVQEVYPGVEIHANMITGIIDESIKLKPGFTVVAEFFQVLLIGLILSILIPCISPLIANIIFGISLALIVGFNFYIWETANLVLPIALLLLMLLSLYLFNMAFGFFIERRVKREISNLFGQYIPTELADEMSENPSACSMDAENRVMSVLFSDVRGFTTISEGLEPTELSELMNAILTPLTGVIHENRGTIDKYMGDAIMAFWGAPLEDENHARHALRAGYDMIERLQALKHEFKERGWPEINVGVGINTGEMSVGNMGSEFRMAYTVLGDTVNLGARLEGLTKNYGVDIIVSESTKEAVPDYIYMKLDRVRVKGKNEPVTIYEPVALIDEISPDEEIEIDEYDKALKFYYSQDWGRAKSKFNLLKESYSGKKIYEIYLERIGDYIIEPPPETWDGVFTHTTK
jgi:adenylate cyclase